MLLKFATEWFTPLIVTVGSLHLLFLLGLRIWAARDVRNLAQSLSRFTDGLSRRSRLDWRGHLTDQIDAFVEDVRDALQDSNDRIRLGERLKTLDEQREYLDSFRFERAWNVARSGIEVYPLLGVLGTILALWLAMREPMADATSSISTIVQRFGIAIDSTFAGLGIAVVLMVVNSFFETLFIRLSENRRAVRELVAHVKRELISDAISANEGAK